jgi:putative oxidoreductase
MKIASTIARYLLGLIFLVLGLNGFLHFIPLPPPKGLAAQQFGGAIFTSHYWVVIFSIQVLGGVLLLVNRFVVLALVLLGPVIVNIFFFHALMAPEGLPLAIVVVVLWAILAVRYKQYLTGIFVQNAA